MLVLRGFPRRLDVLCDVAEIADFGLDSPVPLILE